MFHGRSAEFYRHHVLWNLKAEGLIVIGIQRVLFHRRLLLLQSLSILEQVNLHIGI